MLLTNCAACAAPLAHNAPRCVRCRTRYCNATCQHDHWRRGHKQICKKIHRGGNAEHYHANKKFKEALAVAVEACAEDTKGQTCYICMEAVHPSTGEGLVRGCACQGDQGFAHVSCLVRQSEVYVGEKTRELQEKMVHKIKGEKYKGEVAQAVSNRSATLADIYDEVAELNKLALSCKLCKKKHDAIILHALGWGCWKRCAGKSESRLHDDYIEISNTLTNLVICLKESGHMAEAMEVQQACEQFREGTGV